MNAIVLDTHVVVWALLQRNRLSPTALAILETANQSRSTVYVSAISIVEIIYLVEKGRLPDEVKSRLASVMDSPNTNMKVASLNREIADCVEHIPRNIVPDMPDRIIAATAMYLGVPLVSRDKKIRATELKTIW